jgi:class 3 adenylate cyclase
LPKRAIAVINYFFHYCCIDFFPMQLTSFVQARIQAAMRRASLFPKEYEEIFQNYLLYEDEVAVLITDMTGFTSTTRKLGITHFASLILQCRTLLRPVFEKYAAIEVFTEADDIWAVFPSAQHATLAALDGQHTLASYNSLQKHPNFQIRLSGFGIDAGRHIYVSRHDGKLFGLTVDRAFHLGEDLAEDCSILVTDYVRRQLLQSNETPYFSLFHQLNPSSASTLSSSKGTFPGYIEFVPFVSDTTEADIGPIWTMKGRLPYPPTTTTTTTTTTSTSLGINKLLDPAPESNPGIITFLQRHRIMLEAQNDMNTKLAQLQQLDDEIRLQFTKHVTVMMYGCDWVSLLKLSNVEHTLLLRHMTHSLLAPIVRELNGQVLEENLFFFSSPLDALRAMIKMNRTILRYNKTVTHPTKVIPLKGIALHSGDVVVVPNSNVHWGDPVNTASKLAEDLATGGMLLITTTVQQAVANSAEFLALHAEPLTLRTNKDTFLCYQLTDPTPHQHHYQLPQTSVYAP